ncbi:MAG: transporter, partial [Myxococcales bacterium]|nr:transporter [Myxococcales bacterium]
MHLRLEPAAPAPTVDLDPLSLALHASGPVAAVLFLLIAAAVGAWAIAVIKHRQLGRWIAAEDALDLAVAAASDPDELTRIAARHPDAPGAPVLAALARRRGEDDVL